MISVSESSGFVGDIVLMQWEYMKGADRWDIVRCRESFFSSEFGYGVCERYSKFFVGQRWFLLWARVR